MGLGQSRCPGRAASGLFGCGVIGYNRGVICVCMYIYIYTSVYIYICIYVYTYMGNFQHTHTHTPLSGSRTPQTLPREKTNVANRRDQRADNPTSERSQSVEKNPTYNQVRNG